VCVYKLEKCYRTLTYFTWLNDLATKM